MQSISMSVLLMFILSICFQIYGQSIWPLTKGFTRLWPTVISSIAQIIGLFLFSRVIASGVELSLLVPFAGAASPLILVFVGFFIYKEKASPLKVTLLLSACVLIAFANFF